MSELQETQDLGQVFSNIVDNIGKVSDDLWKIRRRVLAVEAKLQRALTDANIFQIAADDDLIIDQVKAALTLLEDLTSQSRPPSRRSGRS